MRKEVKAVYYCEFCGKHTLSASHTSRHEKYCRKNPKNMHKCFAFCEHLKRTRTGRRTEFKCSVDDVKMYSYLLEKKESYSCNLSGRISGLMRMPLTCAHYKEIPSSKRTITIDNQYDFE